MYNTTLDKIITVANTQLQAISELEMSHKSTPEKWSKKEILGHLVDSAYNNHRRFMQALFQENLVFEGYDQALWVQSNDYQNQPIGKILSSFIASNRHLNIAVSNIPEEVLNRKTSNHNFHKICMNVLEEGATTSLSYLVWDYIFHLEHHLSQIIPDYKKINRSKF